MCALDYLFFGGTLSWGGTAMGVYMALHHALGLFIQSLAPQCVPCMNFILGAPMCALDYLFIGGTSSALWGNLYHALYELYSLGAPQCVPWMYLFFGGTS